jgi:PAS domain S-box-containing protein
MGEDIKKTKQQLIHELENLRRKVAGQEYREKTAETEQRRAEEAFLESEARYKTLIDSAADWIYMINRDNRVLSMNTAAADIFHKQPSQLIGKSLDELFPKEVAEGYAASLSKVFRTGRPRSSETVLVAGDRKSFISAQLSPVRNRHGKITAVMGITRDITRRKEAEEELKVHRGHLEELVKERSLSLQKINRKLQDEITERKSAESKLLQAREDWENIFQAIGYPTLILDSHHTIITANRASEKAVHMSLKKLIGKKCYEIFHGTKQHPKECPLQKLLASGETGTVEMEMETLNGTFLVSCTPVFDNTGRIERIIHIATDITERKKAKEKIEYQANLVENVSDAILSCDMNFNILTWNRAAEKIYGWRADEVIGKNLTDVVPVEFPDDSRENVVREFLEKGHWKGEGIQHHRNGKALHILSSSTIIKDEKGKNTSLVTINKDITDQMQAQRERERILNLSNDLICIVGMDGYFKYLNPAWEKTLGYTVKQLMMKPFLDFIYPDDHGTSVAAVGKLARSSESFDFENRYIHADGSVRTISWRATPVAGEGLIYCVGRDITEMKQTMDEFRTAKDFLANLIETANAIILTLDEKAKITTFNNFAEKLTGYTKEEVLGKNWFKCFIPKRERNEIPQIFRDVLHKMPDSSSHENTIVCKDATEKIVNWKNTVVKDAEGHISGVLSIGIDVTERRRAVEALEESEKKTGTAPF